MKVALNVYSLSLFIGALGFIWAGAVLLGITEDAFSLGGLPMVVAAVLMIASKIAFRRLARKAAEND